MEINWKTIEKNGYPDNSSEYGFNTPYIPCIVSACDPNNPIGAVIETCRWDSKNNEWLKSDIKRNWALHAPYVITHYIDNLKNPHEL